MVHLLKPLGSARFISLVSHNTQQQKLPSIKFGKVPEKIKQAQKLFQAKNDLPVFLKGGKTDRILYYTTLGLSGIGLCCNIAFFAHYIID